MILHKFSLNFKNARYEKEYHLQTEKYQKKINILQCIIFMIFSFFINLDVFIYTKEQIIILTGLIPLLIGSIALYKNIKQLSQAKVYMFFAIITHVILSASLQYQRFREYIERDQNFIFGSLTGLIVGIVASGLQQWFLKEVVVVVYIFITFLSAIDGFTFNQIGFFIPIIIIQILLSNIISYYKEMQVKIQFYDQLVAKDTIYDLKNLLQNNIPQSIFVVSQKPRKQHKQSTQSSNKKGNNGSNNIDQDNRNDSQLSIDCEDELVINFQNKYFSEYQQKYKFSNDITSFLKLIKIPQGLQTQLNQGPSKLQDPPNAKNLCTPHFGINQQQSILDVIIQQVKDTVNEKASQNDPILRQRRQTIAQDKGFQLDDIKEFINCQYRQDNAAKSSVLNKANDSNKERKSSSKRRKKNGNSLMSEFRNFGRALSQISIKNFTGSNATTPRGGNALNELTFQNQNALNASSNIYNAAFKKRQNSKSPNPDTATVHPNYHRNNDIRRKSKTVSAQVENNKSQNHNNNKLRQVNPLQINTKITNLSSHIRKQTQNSSSLNQSNLKQQNSIPIDKNSQQLQIPLQNVSLYPNQTSEIHSFSQYDQQSNIPSAQKQTTNKLNHLASVKQEVDSIYNKQSRLSITSQNLQTHQRYSTHKSQQAGVENSLFNKRNSAFANNGGHQNSSVNNLTNKQNNKNEKQIPNKQFPNLYFDIQLVKCQWEENDAVMVIMNDISEKMMNLRLKEGDKYKDEMLATVTHNLKTPLNSMILLINKLMRKEKKNKELKIISQSCHMLLSMIMDILDYQCIKRKTFKLQIEAFDLLDVIQEVKQLYQITADIKGLEINIVNNIKNPEMQLVLQDMDRIKQILNNLVGNAIKFTKKGSITITINFDCKINSDGNPYKVDSTPERSSKIPSHNNNHSPPPPPPPTSLSKNQTSNNDEYEAEKSLKLNNYQRIFQNNGVIAIEVKDTGSGIEEALQENLFKIFATHDHNNGTTRHGVGLGLTICKKLARLIGPRREIHLDSSPGKGSSFTFYIYQNLLTSPKQYKGELKNQISPIIISSSQENSFIQHVQPPPLSQNRHVSYLSENEQAQQIPMFLKGQSSINQHINQSSANDVIDTKNVHSSPKNSEKSNNNKVTHIDSPVFKTDNIDTGVTPRNQQSIQFRSSDASFNHIKDDKQHHLLKLSNFKNESKSRKKSSKLFQGSQISLFLDLNNPLPESKQFEKTYLNSFLNFTPRSNLNFEKSQTAVTLNNLHQKQLTKRRDSDQENEASSLKLIGNNNIISPNVTSSNLIIPIIKEKEFTKQLISQNKQKSQFDECDDILLKSGEINDIILSEIYNKTPDKQINQYSDQSPNNNQNTKPLIQTPKKSLFNLDSRNLIHHKSFHQTSFNNLHQFPQSSTSISIDRHLNNYASNNLLATNVEFNNKFDEKFHNGDNMEDDENFKPLKYLESQTMIGIESHRQNLLNKRNSSMKSEQEQIQNSKHHQHNISDSSAVIPYSEQQIIENERESYSDNIQDDSGDINNSSYSDENIDDYQDQQDQEDLGNVEEDEDESKEDDDNNMNLEGLFSNTINALIVDDTPFNIFVLKSFFQNCKNIKFSQAFDGKEALELYKENRYDLIFMDLNMPIMDGFESISQIRQFEHENNFKETIIFAVTAQDQIKDIQKCIDCGANGHIPKPVKLSLLYSSLYQYFKRR